MSTLEQWGTGMLVVGVAGLPPCNGFIHDIFKRDSKPEAESRSTSSPPQPDVAKALALFGAVVCCLVGIASATCSGAVWIGLWNGLAMFVLAVVIFPVTVVVGFKRRVARFFQRKSAAILDAPCGHLVTIRPNLEMSRRSLDIPAHIPLMRLAKDTA